MSDVPYPGDAPYPDDPPDEDNPETDRLRAMVRNCYLKYLKADQARQTAEAKVADDQASIEQYRRVSSA